MKAVVLGGGIVGMWTAEVLSARGHEVVVRTDSPSFSTTSAAAVCVITPLFPSEAGDEIFKTSWAWFEITLAKFEELDTGGRFLERIPSFEFGYEENGELYLEKGFNIKKFAYLPFSAVEIIRLATPIDVQNHLGDRQRNVFGAKFVSVLCNTEVFLAWLRSTLEGRGVVFDERIVVHRDELKTIDADVIFNCLGFRSGNIFPDNELRPVRGQSMFIDSDDTDGPFFGIASGHHAVFKHRRGFYVGSYFLEGEKQVHTWPQRAEYELSLQFVKGPYPELCRVAGFEPPKIDLRRIRRVNTGIRPYRTSGPRVATEIVDGVRVVHNYGHGAHGWTIGYATALQAALLGEVIGSTLSHQHTELSKLVTIAAALGPGSVGNGIEAATGSLMHIIGDREDCPCRDSGSEKSEPVAHEASVRAGGTVNKGVT
jgi:glycine/D-amino acid oxidase-like deaminating enzyme